MIPSTPTLSVVQGVVRWVQLKPLFSVISPPSSEISRIAFEGWIAVGLSARMICAETLALWRSRTTPVFMIARAASCSRASSPSTGCE